LPPKHRKIETRGSESRNVRYNNDNVAADENVCDNNNDEKPQIKRRKTSHNHVSLQSVINHHVYDEHGKTFDYFDEQCRRLTCMECYMKDHKGNRI
jgi:hypothetical protein